MDKVVPPYKLQYHLHSAFDAPRQAHNKPEIKKHYIYKRLLTKTIFKIIFWINDQILHN